MPSVQLFIGETKNIVEVSYPQREAKLAITAAEYDLITTALKDRKVPAIKFIRVQYGLDLYEAKQVVDTIFAQMP